MKRYLLGIVLFLTLGISHAFVVEFDPNDANNVLAVRSLQLTVNGVTGNYDVVFRADSSHLAPDPGDIFAMATDPLGGAYSLAQRDADASAAAAAINAAFNSAMTTVSTVGSTKRFSYMVPWLYDDKSCVDQGQGGSCGWRGLDAGGGIWGAVASEFDPAAALEIAEFSAVVPVPAAVWLFGSGLAFLGWLRRGRQTAQGAAAA